MKHKQIVAFLLALTLFFSCLPFPAIAEGTDMEQGVGDSSAEAFFDGEKTNNEDSFSDWDDSFEEDAPEDEENDSSQETDPDAADQEHADDPEEDSFREDGAQPDGTEDSEEDENWDEYAEDADETNNATSDTSESAYSEPVQSLWESIGEYGYAYVLTKGETKVYDTPERTGEPLFILTEKDAVLLATAYYLDLVDSFAFAV